ncbi:hypothetical protein ACOSQ3_003968 [Xanthoceras sorbifolium]
MSRKSQEEVTTEYWSKLSSQSSPSMKKDTNKGGPHNKEENEVEDLVEEVQKPEVEAEEEETQIEEDVDIRTMSHEEEDEEEEADTTTIRSLIKEMSNAIIATNMATIATSAEATQMR